MKGCPNMKETTALGAALAGALAVGVFKPFQDFKPVSGHTLYQPKTNDEGRISAFRFGRL